ncbi:MAG: histidine triad nucleotide-binding protein [Candidatus Nealsonbacteria bacterium]
MEDCLFCKIIKKEVPSEVVYEDESFIAIKDIKPKAPIHLLLIPKKHIASVDELAQNDKELIGDLILAAKQVARDNGLDKTGYKLNFNVGRGGGQLVDHIHLHLLSGFK